MNRYRSAVNRVKFAREAGAITRVHQHKVVLGHDIAQHVYGALCILRVLHPSPSIDLVWAVLSHDKPERFTGDIPAPAKWHADWFDKEKYEGHENEILRTTGFDWKSLTEQEQKWLKAVDALEFYLFCLDQEMLGNKTLERPKRKMQSYIEERVHVWPIQVRDFWVHLQEMPWSMCPELGEE